ncbi:MAG: hypothetical protein ACRDJB_04405 [Actinomycetota bacterium]
MHGTELLLLTLVLAVAGLSILARTIGVPYPILLVVGGLVIGFVTGLADVELPPELVLLMFLPPLLYYTRYFHPRGMRGAVSLAAALALPLESGSGG